MTKFVTAETQMPGHERSRRLDLKSGQRHGDNAVENSIMGGTDLIDSGLVKCSLQSRAEIRGGSLQSRRHKNVAPYVGALMACAVLAAGPDAQARVASGIHAALDEQAEPIDREGLAQQRQERLDAAREHRLETEQALEERRANERAANAERRQRAEARMQSQRAEAQRRREARDQEMARRRAQRRSSSGS